MKVIFSHNLPFALAHGGVQTQVEALMRELGALGVAVEPERWWDAAQQADILHYFGRPPTVGHVRQARLKGRRVVMFENLDQTASRSRPALLAQRLLIRAARATPGGLTNRLAWDCYGELDAMIYATSIEWDVAKYLFQARHDRGHIIPQGIEARALEELQAPAPQEDYLVSVATITARKNSVLLAEAARIAQVPVLFLGRPYSEDDEYFRQFRALVDGKFVRHEGFVPEEVKFARLRSARGFALLSQFESGCIAVHEAAATGLPLLLPDLPWAARVYDGVERARFVGLGSAEAVAGELARFHSESRRGPGPTFHVLSWRAVAEAYLRVYQTVLAPTPPERRVG
ncbi:MAG: glycosyltransferase [Verrucomicrobia bacterium]|nr:glycosyltransferase [Verrucomicrobiota bacterium]